MISPCASNNKSSLLLNNITQPDTVGMGPKINKSVKSHCKMAGLERLHHNALGFTKRADLLSKITGNSTKVLHATTRTPALCESTEEFDDTWLDEVDKFDDLKSPEQDRNTKLNPDVVSDHAEDRRCKSYRRPVKRILDFLSDDELENIDTRIPERRSGSISRGNREQNFGYQRSAKRARTDQVPGHDEDIHTLQTVSPVPFVTKCNQRNASSDLALEPINVEGASPIEIDEEIAQASQEFAALRPFKNMDGIDVNFMAQFTDCCEFIE